jgi:hypothetical protein
LKKKKTHHSLALVAYACNPSYSGGKDQADHGLKSAWVNSLQDPISKTPITKNWAGGVSQGEGPEFKPQYRKRKEKKRKKKTYHKNGLVEWLKVSSNPNSEKKKK